LTAKKTHSTFFCQNCGNQSTKWLGKCPQCNQWNTFVEEIINHGNTSKGEFKTNIIHKPSLLSNIDYSNEQRIISNDKELNRVLGGGIVPGSIILLGGDPGIGKSTLLLQFALSLKNKKNLYISGEESQKQIKMRAERINKNSEHCYILTETSTQNIFQQIEKIEPDILIVDSIQTLHTANIDSSPGSVSQIRECTSELIKFAKETSTAVLLIGHINKDGAIAGPKVLEHMQTPLHLKMMETGRHVHSHVRGFKTVNTSYGPLTVNPESFKTVAAPTKSVPLFNTSTGGTHPKNKRSMQHT